MLNNFDSSNVEYRITRKSKDKAFLLATANAATQYKGRQLLRTEIEALVDYIDDVDFNLLKQFPPGVIVDRIAKVFVSRTLAKKTPTINMHEVQKMQLGTFRADVADNLAEAECAPYRVHGKGMLGMTGLEGFKPHGPRVLENFAHGMAKARNSEEDNKQYNVSQVDPGLLIEETGALTTPTALVNMGRPFSSLRDKFPMTAKQRLQNVYLLLDSKQRNLTTTDSVFKWTVLYSGSEEQGVVNTLSDEIHDIVNVQFDRIRIPYVPSADNVYRKISLYVEEWDMMAVLTNNGRRYHMMFDAEIVGNQIELTPLINDEGRFRFYTPINILNDLTLKFYSPFSPITFLPDRYNVTITSLNPVQSLLTFSEDHNVTDGELVLISDYTTLAPVADQSQILFVNREEGHIVTYISNTVLRIEAPLSTVTPNPNNLAKCFIASRRLIIPLRMEYILQT